jgi:hypothetical protein
MKGLSKKTIEDDCANIDFYINEFLLYEDIVCPEDGALSVGMFLGYWFIRKAMWATKTSIKSNATSLKRFYGFMLEKGMIPQKDLDDLKRRIKAPCVRIVVACRRSKAVGVPPTARPGATGAYSDGQELQRRI